MHLKIGDFARLSRVSIKTLRYYDEIDLFKPAHVDRFTSYRYYGIEQLAQIHRIMALKDLNLSLEQIRLMLHTELPIEHIQGMLDLKEAELQQEVQAIQARLKQVRFRLNSLRAEDDISKIDITVAEVPAIKAVVEHILVQRNDKLIMSDEIRARGKLYKEIFDCYKIPQNPPISIFYNFDIDSPVWHTKSVMPVDRQPDTEIKLSDGSLLSYETIPKLSSAAIYIFKGAYEQIMEQTLLVERWMLENKYIRGKETRIIYHNGPMHLGGQSDFITEIQIEILSK